MKILLKRDEVVYFNRNSFDHQYFLFGPEAYSRLLETEFCSVYDPKNKEPSLEKIFDYHHDLKHAFMGFDASPDVKTVFVDYDEKVFWCNALGTGHDAMWAAAWMEVFWPGWRIFIPEDETVSGLLTLLGHEDPHLTLSQPASFEAFANCLIGPAGEAEVKYIAIMGDECVTFAELGRLGLEALLHTGEGGLDELKTRNISSENILDHEIVGVIDRASKTAWVQEIGYMSRTFSSPDKSLWPGWTILPSVSALSRGARNLHPYFPGKVALQKKSQFKLEGLLQNFDLGGYDDNSEYDRLFAGKPPVKIIKALQTFLDDTPPKEIIVGEDDEPAPDKAQILYEYKGIPIAEEVGDEAATHWRGIQATNEHRRRKNVQYLWSAMVAHFTESCTPSIWFKDRRPPSSTFESKCPYNDEMDLSRYPFVYRAVPVVDNQN